MKVAGLWPSWRCIHCGQRGRQISAGTDSASPAQGQSLASHQVGDQLIHEVSSQGPTGKGGVYAHSFLFVQGEAKRGDLPKGLLGGSQAFTGTGPPCEPKKS